mmetsp:Transcript_24856/g.55225  ORF Transcript_24856/g.55225 Transcript_24856/m.55225 type:complete len:273 (-) Transcript_24856:247-1065(-)
MARSRGCRGLQRHGLLRAAGLCLPVLATVACGSFGLRAAGTAFLPAARGPTGRITRSTATRRPASLGKEIDELLYPPEEMFDLKDDDVLRVIYPGARDLTAIFWSIIVPISSLGFLIVGASAGLGYNLVDLTPFGEYLGFLKPGPAIKWEPQGIFMSFWGAGGLFLYGPFTWYLVLTNKGNGFCEFNKRTKRVTIIRDEECILDIGWNEVRAVKLTWQDLDLGNREVFLILNNGNEVHFQDKSEDPPKRLLERKAAVISDFMGKDLEVDDFS